MSAQQVATLCLQGAKIGFLGVNGAGKSSLMRIIAGEDTEFDGDLNLVPGVRVGYLPQEPILDDSATVLQNVETAVKPVKDMIKEFEDVSIFIVAASLSSSSISLTITLRQSLHD